MAFEQTWRWFGPHDPITLKEIKQTGATGIVTALHHIPTGEIWTRDEIMNRKNAIEAEGLRWTVVESLPVHEEIKQRGASATSYLENYMESLRNLGRCGIDVVCYNFMPVLDWSRTDLNVQFRDGSVTTRFDATAFAAFDLFLLRRPAAEHEYSEAKFKAAKAFFESLDEERKHRLVRTVLLGFPGSGEAYTLETLRTALHNYQGVTENDLRAHLQEFLRAVVPSAEEAGVLLAIHPDDPPWSLLGLPRIVSSASDVRQILGAIDSPNNGLTLCTGSFGAGRMNNLPAMAEEFAPRISFVHLRNVKRSEEENFLEDNHLDGDIDLFLVMKTLLLEQQRREKSGRHDRRMPMRPDHGHLMLDDMKKNFYPGYSLYGRMRALAELRGMEVGIRRSLGLD